MRDEDKPFIYYKTGLWSFKIAPRNAAGFRASIIWVLALAPIFGLFAWALNEAPNYRFVGLFTVIYVATILAWAFAMFRWMKARSEIVDMAELLEIKREQDLIKKRRGR
jgi:membrane protein YdbS with pleckstrin-like domain